MRLIYFITFLIIYEVHCKGANKSCHLPNKLTEDNIHDLSKGCVELFGNLHIDSSIEEKYLIPFFKQTTRIFGCVFIRNKALLSFEFLKSLQSIDCPNTEGNVLELRLFEATSSLGLESLTTIVGPGSIVFVVEDPEFVVPDSLGVESLILRSIDIKWTCSEFELFLNHPQFRGRLLVKLQENKASCSPTFPDFDVPPKCRCIADLIIPTGTIYEKQLDNLKQIEVIFGQLTISLTLLHELTFLSELKYIVNGKGFEEPSIDLIDNEFLSDIQLPNLRSIMSFSRPFVYISNSPLLMDKSFNSNTTCKQYEQFDQGILLGEQLCDFKPHPASLITSILTGDNYLAASIYHLPIILSLLINLRVLIYWISGFTRLDFKILQLLVITQTFGIVLIQIDNLIFYQRIMLPTFSIFSTFSHNWKFKFTILQSFIKFQVSFRDLMMYMPHAVYFTVIAGIMIGRKYAKLCRIRWVIFAFSIFGSIHNIYSNYISLNIEFIISTYNVDHFIELELPKVQRQPYYIKATDMTYFPSRYPFPEPEPYESMDNPRNQGKENERPFFEPDDERPYRMSQLHTDGWMFTRNRIHAEFAMLTVSLLFSAAKYFMPRIFRLCPTRHIPGVVFLQYLLMRYPSIRSSIWHSMTFPFACYTFNDFRPDWEIDISHKMVSPCTTSELTALMGNYYKYPEVKVWQRIIYVGMLAVSLYALHIAKHYHRLSFIRTSRNMKTRKEIKSRSMGDITTHGQSLSKPSTTKTMTTTTPISQQPLIPN